MSEGQAGQPGEPGKGPLGGRGGAGGRGGRGGKAPVASYWKRHRALVGYLFLVVVAFLAIMLYARQQTHSLQHVDREACLRDNILAVNQEDVLHNLISLRLVLMRVPVPARVRKESAREIRALRRDLRRVNLRDCNP